VKKSGRPKLPWLEYEGQTTPELMACKNTHRVDSLLCAFEWGIQAKIGPEGEGALTDEERLVLAVMALTREVNNGGYHQFFVNSSRRFAPTIVDSLRRIGCTTCAEITERAIHAAKFGIAPPDSILQEDDARDAILDACDQEFYRLADIDRRLFDFVGVHQNQIQLRKGSQGPRRRIKLEKFNRTKLGVYLTTSKKKTFSLDEARKLAREIAEQNAIPASEAELEGAAVLYAFGCAVRDGNLSACEVLAVPAFELMRDDTSHCILQRDWVKQLIDAGQLIRADAVTLSYLEYLAGSDLSTVSTQNRILFWASVLQPHRSVLPKSVEFFTTAFPFENLNEPLPRQRFKPKEIPPFTNSR
jgi:Domain of unknown function (DUF4375)